MAYTVVTDPGIIGVMQDRATIFDIQRFSLHDGPGIRTTIFFKGCALHCCWCQNPESQQTKPEMAFYAERCRECYTCLSHCPELAIIVGETARIDGEKCTCCGECEAVCPTGSLRLVGRTWDVDALAAEVLKDRDFFLESGGGITLSGGEPMAQAPFLQRFLPLIKAAGVHVTLETCGQFRGALFDALQPLIDLVYFDLKLIDPQAHRAATGRGNQTILANFAKLSREAQAFQARMPLVPTWTDREDNLRAIAEKLRDHDQRSLHCLPYNNLGEAKLSRLTTSQRPLALVRQDAAALARITSYFREHAIDAVIYD